MLPLLVEQGGFAVEYWVTLKRQKNERRPPVSRLLFAERLARFSLLLHLTALLRGGTMFNIAIINVSVDRGGGRERV